MSERQKHENPVLWTITWIQRRAELEGGTLEDAARAFKRAHRATALRVVEEIGSWPSSEPQLRALQAVWP